MQLLVRIFRSSLQPFSWGKPGLQYLPRFSNTLFSVCVIGMGDCWVLGSVPSEPNILERELSLVDPLPDYSDEGMD